MTAPQEIAYEPPADDARLYSTRHAAAFLDVSERTVRNLIRRGDLRPVLVMSLQRIPLSELRAFVAGQRARGRVTPLRPRKDRDALGHSLV